MSSRPSRGQAQRARDAVRAQTARAHDAGAGARTASRAPHAPPASGLRRALFAAAPALLAVLLYANSIGFGLYYDDVSVVVEDKRLKSVSGLFDITLKERPVRFVSLWIDQRLFGGSAAGFHFVNVLLHAGAGILALLYIRRLAELAGVSEPRRSWIALVASLLFVAHPIHTEAVNLVTNRKEMLATIFVLLALWRALSRPLTALRIAEVCAWFALGVFAKASALAAVPLLAAQEWLFASGALARVAGGASTQPSRGASRHARSVALVAATSLIAIGFFVAERNEVRGGVRKLKRITESNSGGSAATAERTLDGEAATSGDRAREEGASAKGEPSTSDARPRENTDVAGVPRTRSYPPLVLPARLFVEYLRLLVWPRPLLLERPVIHIAGVGDPLVWTGALAWVALLVVAWILRQRALVALSLVWLAVTPIPTLNIIPLNYPIADRYVYLPSIGFAILVAGAIVVGALRLAPRRARLAIAAATGALVVVSALAIFERAVDWRSEDALLASTLRDNPEAPEALRYSARRAAKAGDSKLALSLAHRAIDALPTAPESWRTLGDLFWDAGKTDSAEVAYRTEWKLSSHRGETANRLGIIAAGRADGPESVKWFRAALAKSRRDPGIRENLGRALIASGERDEGRAMLEELVAKHPSRADAWGILAYSYWREGDETRAREVLASGLRALPRDPTLNRLAAQWQGAQAPSAQPQSAASPSAPPLSAQSASAPSPSAPPASAHSTRAPSPSAPPPSATPNRADDSTRPPRPPGG